MGLCVLEGKGNKQKTVNLGSGTSFNVSSYIGYERFTLSNFRIASVSISSQSNAWYGGTGAATVVSPLATKTMTMSYNNSTGVLTISNNVIGTGGSSGEGGNTCGSTTTLTPTVHLVY